MKDDICPVDDEPKAFTDKLCSGLAQCLRAAVAGSEKGQTISLLIALSGGTDSTALLIGLHELSCKYPFRLVACHVNHRLRGEDADADEAFCKALCKQMDIPIVIKSISLDNGTRSNCSEEILRERRYQLLSEVARAEGIKYIAVAHICEDQFETILFRLFRGSSLRGLTGMRAARELPNGLVLLRPLLNVSKGDCQEYLDAHSVVARQDRSNDDTAYARNYLRHRVLPTILSRFPTFPQHLASLRAIIQSEEEFWHELTIGSLDALSSATASENLWAVSQFQALPLALKRRIMAESMRQRDIEVSFARVESVIRLVLSPQTAKEGESVKGALTLSPDWAVRVSRKHIKWVKTAEMDPITLDELTVRVPGINMALACGKVLRIEDLAHIKNEEIGPFPEMNALDVLVDLGRAVPPLVLRSRRPGDVITPFGMQVSVNLKKYLHTHKSKSPIMGDSGFERIPLLADQTEVLWIPGVGISEKLRATGRPSHRLSWLDIASDPVGLA